MKAEKPKVALGTLPPPSMYQLAYEAPKVDHAPQHTIVGLAMSLELATPNIPKEIAFNVYSGASNVAPTPSYPPPPGQASYDPTHTDTKNEGQQSPNEQSKSQKNESNARPKPVTRTRTQKNLNQSPHIRNISTPNQKSHKPKTANHQIQLLIPRNHLLAHPPKLAQSTLLYALSSPTRSGIYYLEKLM